MRKDKTELCFAWACLILCASLSLGMLVFGPSKAGANERLTPKPQLFASEELNTAFLSDVSSYVSDHFFYRQELITARNKLAALLGSSLVEDVILGSDGWLYYAPTLDDYTGAGAMSGDELFAIARNLFLMQEYCETQGMAFQFVPAPNKNSLYGAAMPDYGALASEHDAQRLFRLLDEQGVNYTDLFSVFRNQKETLYFAHDSHWNSRGAALAADEINAGFGRSSTYCSDGFLGSIAHSGDLFEMLYPADHDPETDPVYSGALAYTRDGADTRADSITINTTGENSGTLLAFRDSFGNLLYPYLADSFASARFSRMTSYNLLLGRELDADFVLVELVERNLDYLLRYVPIMPAPARELLPPKSISGYLELECVTETMTPEGYILYLGTLPKGSVSAPVYVYCEGTAFEAFTLKDGGFAAFVPAEEKPELVLIHVGTSLEAYTVE